MDVKCIAQRNFRYALGSALALDNQTKFIFGEWHEALRTADLLYEKMAERGVQVTK